MSEARATATRILGYAFQRPELLDQALTHRSAAGGRRRRAPLRASNERLEFVGDRVLGLLVAEWLIERFPKEQEGALGPRLASLVSRDTLAGVAERVGLSEVLTVGANEKALGVARLATVLADALEALLGAMFLDGGLEPARRFVREAWEPELAAQRAPPKDAKTGLQEWLLAHGFALPDYAVLSRDGPSHAPRFVVTASGGGAQGRGEAGSKREAERLAAADLLAQLTAAA